MKTVKNNNLVKYCNLDGFVERLWLRDKTLPVGLWKHQPIF